MLKNKKMRRIFSFLVSFALVLQIIGPVVAEGPVNENIEDQVIGEGSVEDSNDLESESPAEEGPAKPEEAEEVDRGELSESEGEGPEEKAPEEEVDQPESEGDSEKTEREEAGDLKNQTGFNYKVNLSFYDNDGEKIEENEIHLDALSELTYRVDFTIDDGFKFIEGDKLSLDISGLSKIGGIDLSKLGEKTLYFKDGEDFEVGSYKVEDDKLVISFTENIERLNGLKERKGFAELEFKLDKEVGKKEILEEIKLEEIKDKTFVIRRAGSSELDIKKTGEYDEESDKLIWTIDINTHLNDLKDAVLIDQLDKRLKLEKVEMKDLKVSLDGSDDISAEKAGKYGEIWPENEQEVNYPVTIGEDNKLELKLGALGRQAKRIRLTTSMIEDSLEAPSELDIGNTAQLEDGDKTATSTANLSFERNTGIKKSAQIVDHRYVDWQIEVRGDGSKEDIVVEDILDWTPKGDEALNFELRLDEVKLGEESLAKKSEGDSESPYYEILSEEGGPSKIKFTIPNSDGIQTIKYRTEIVYLDEKSGKVTLNNKASYNNKSDSAQVTLDRENINSKQADRVYRENGETYMDWTISLNSKNEHWTNVRVEDDIPEGFEFVKASIDKGEIKLPPTYDVSKNSVKIEIGELTGSAKLTIKTKLVDKSIFANNEDGYKDKIINEASIYWTVGDDKKGEHIGGNGSGASGGTGSGNEGDSQENRMDVEGEIGKDRFNHKLEKDGQIKSYKEGLIDWTVNYTTYRQGLEGVVIKDSLDYAGFDEHSYVKDSFILKVNGQEYKLKESEDPVETEDSANNKLKYSLVFEENSFTLKIVEGESLNDLANELELQYQTKFELDKLKDKNNNVFKNKVVVTNKNNIDAEDEVGLSEEVSRNGYKSGKHLGERVFEWTVHLNHKGKEIKDGEIVDTLSPGHEYVEDSIKLVKAEIQEDGSLKALGSEIDLTDKLTIKTVKNEEENPEKTMTIILGEDYKNTPLILTYKTKAKGISKEKYSNKVSYNKKDYKSSVGYGDWDKHIEKKALLEGKGYVSKGDILEWELKVNQALSEISKFKLEDQMSEGLILIKDSIEILDGQNDVTEEFKISLSEDNKLTIEKDKIDKAYTIRYKTLVMSGEGEISNSAKVSGTGLGVKKVPKVKINVSSRMTAGGSGVRGKDKYEVLIKKVDSKGELIKDSEAKFILITISTINGKEIRSEEEISTKNGEIKLVLEKNAYNRYYIEESEAPAGYVLSKEILEIDLDKAENNKLELSYLNYAKEEVKDIEVNKVWKGGPDKKPGIWIQLYRDGEAFGEKVFLDDGETSHVFKNLPISNSEGKEYVYTIDELDPPAGYEKQVDQESFTITNSYRPKDPGKPIVPRPEDPGPEEDPEKEPKEEPDLEEEEEKEMPDPEEETEDEKTVEPEEDLDKEDKPGPDEKAEDKDRPNQEERPEDKEQVEDEENHLPRTGRANFAYLIGLGLLISLLGFVSLKREF